MLPRLAATAPVLLAIGCTQLALGALSPLIGLLLVHRGVPTPMIGVVTSSYFVGFLIGALTSDRVVRRVGHIRAFAVFAALAADSVLAQAVTEAPVLWAVLRALTGYAISGIILIAESWLNHKCDSTTRGRVFGTYLVVSWAASAVGPLALNFASRTGHDLFIAIAAGFATALVPMALTLIGNPEIAERSAFGVRQLFAVSPLGLAACLAAGLVNSAFFGMMPVYIERIGLSAAHLSVLLTIALLGGLFAQYPIGALSDRLGRRPVTLATILCAGLCAAAILVSGGRSFAVLLGLAFLFGAAVAPLYGLGAGQTNDYVPAKDFVAASGGLLFTWALGASAGPTIAAGVMGMTGPGGLFLYALAVLAATGGFTVYRMWRRVGVPLELQSDFVPAPQTPPRLPELDPRSEP